MFSVRLLTLDHYLSKPIPELSSNYDDYGKVSAVASPVLRIFGPTLSGEKACVHIHGVYPYLYVPYEGGENSDRDALLLAAGLDRALQASNKQNDRFPNSYQRYVYRVRLVSGMPMYGYHSRQRQFFKVYFFNPYSIRKAAELLLSGAILNMRLQPHETHIPFTQQFMIDFNLFGMNIVNFKKVMHRQNVSEPESMLGIDKEFILPSNVKRTSYCFFEVDVLAEDILNRGEDCDAVANPGLVGIWEEEKARRRLKGRLSELTQCPSDPRPFHVPQGVEVDFLNDLKQRLLKISDAEKGEIIVSGDVRAPYPAELPENSTILEASILDASSAGDEVELYKSESDLINETIVQELSQRLEKINESGGADSSDSGDEHMEDNRDGRGEGAGPEGDEAELDMTQPLSPPTGWTAVSEKPGDCSGDSEEEFWKEMADNVIQMDGADDSDGDNQFSLGSSEPLSTLPNNVLSFLDDHCLDFQTSQETQPIWDVSNPWSPWTYSPMPNVLTPVSITDPSHENLFDPLNHVAPDTPDSSITDSMVNHLHAIGNNDNLPNTDTWTNLKNLIGSKGECANSLTLREYLKGDVVHVDFKVINGQEMVVIEYSSLENKKSSQNKFLIKPLYQFIEEWNKAEVASTNNRPKYIHGFTPVKKKKVVPKKQQSKGHVDKECQTLFDNIESGNSNKTYSINESVISKKKIILKLVTSQSTFQDSSNCNYSVVKPIDEVVQTPHYGCDDNIQHPTSKTCPNLRSSAPRYESSKNLDPNTIIPKKEPDTIDIHDDLVKNVNEKFEEYYQRLIGKKKTNTKIKTEHEVIDVIDSSTGSDTETDNIPFNRSKIARKKSLVYRKRRSKKNSSIDPIDFVSQILSNYSKMPNTSSLPPMSITVNIGDPNVPVQVNMQPNRNYFDGADDSSSDDTIERKPRRKKAKYRPLEVLVQPSPIRTRGKRKDNLPSSCSSQSESLVKPKAEFSAAAKRNVSSSCCSSMGEIPNIATSSESTQKPESMEINNKKLRRSARCTKKSIQSPLALKLSRDNKTSGSGREKHDVINKLIQDIPQTDMLASSSDDQSITPKSLSPKLIDDPRNETEADLFLSLSKSPELISQREAEKESKAKELSSNSCSPEHNKANEVFDQIFINNPEMDLKQTIFTYNVKPPTKKDIMDSLNKCSVLQPTSKVPHYSNYKDAKKHMEIGNKVLKLEHPFSNLKQHYSTQQITSIEEYRKLATNGKDLTKASLGKDPIVMLTPVIRAPTRKEVLKSPKYCEKITKVLTPKIKLLVPAGEESISGDESMSLTPCTPSIVSDNSPSCTPLTPQIPRGVSPEVTESHIYQRRVSFDDIVECMPFQSTPARRQRSQSSTSKESQSKKQQKDLLGKSKGRRSLLSRLNENRRFSIESNKSTDIFEVEEDANIPKNDSEEKKSPKISSAKSDGSKNKSCQIQGVSLNNTFGFKNSLQNFQDAKPNKNFQYTTLLVMEVLTEARDNFLPDPQFDGILAIFYALVLDYPKEIAPTIQNGVLVVGYPLKNAAVTMKVKSFPDEKCLIKHFVSQIRMWNPDIVAGYEIEKGSWGYLLHRAYIIGMNILPQLGRIVKDEKEIVAFDAEEDIDNVPKIIKHLKIPGRIVMNVWRLLRHEIALTSYTFENIMFHLLHERHSKLSDQLLAQLWQNGDPKVRYIPADYFMTRVMGACRILAQLDLISRNSELAKVFGIQFEEVLTRGSQFRVESMMLRLAKPSNFIPVSPNIQQRAHMRAPGSLPLIMEPESRYYADPVIVLDFQSLYPSMIIAHNYCFSTCLGRVTHLGRGEEPFEFGCTRLSIPSADLIGLADGNIHVSPAGVAFVRSNIRKGILPSMLEEILDTRLMVKKSMKENKSDKLLQKVLHARQLGLKLIANVTYGYTAANFSGRMPCIEVGDSVVSKGRETLQRAIRLVESTPRWGARVVYGDTDSLFVQTPGRTRQQAFQIGEEIANAVTQDNPRPVKLKLEKVYQPCILQTKKRYVGYMYESAEQVNPVYEAKGIETVRRDGCPATAKILQKALHILFDTADVSLVKKYTLQQFAKIFQGRVNLQDLIFAKEYRGRRGYRPGACVPALQLAKQWTSADHRAEPRNKERVPYLIVHGAPGVPLIRLVRSPRDLLADSNLRIHAAYYITKAIIPPLQRCFTLLGADPLAWYAEMPRRYHRIVRSGLPTTDKPRTISQYFESLDCVSCGRLTHERVCSNCLSNPALLLASLSTKTRKWERAQKAVLEVCRSCCLRDSNINCISLDCPVLYRRHQIDTDARQVPILRDRCHKIIHN